MRDPNLIAYGSVTCIKTKSGVYREIVVDVVFIKIT